MFGKYTTNAPLSFPRRMFKGLPHFLLVILIGFCHISISHQMINWDMISKSSEPQSLSNFLDTFYLNGVSVKNERHFFKCFFKKSISVINIYIFQEPAEFKRNNNDLASQFFQSYKRIYNRARAMMGKSKRSSPFVRWYLATRMKKNSPQNEEENNNLENTCNTSKNNVENLSVQTILRCLYFYRENLDI